jgi:hypothetical protein
LALLSGDAGAVAKEGGATVGGAQGVIGGGDGLVPRAGELAALALLAHLLGKANLIDRKALLAANHLGQIEGEAVGVVQLEGDLAGQDLGVAGAGGKRGVADEAQAAIDGAAEALVFGVDGLFDEATGLA